MRKAKSATAPRPSKSGNSEAGTGKKKPAAKGTKKGSRLRSISGAGQVHKATSKKTLSCSTSDAVDDQCKEQVETTGCETAAVSVPSEPQANVELQNLQEVVAQLQEQLTSRIASQDAASVALEKERRRADVLSQILHEQQAILKESSNVPVHIADSSGGQASRQMSNGSFMSVAIGHSEETSHTVPKPYCEVHDGQQGPAATRTNSQSQASIPAHHTTGMMADDGWVEQPPAQSGASAPGLNGSRGYEDGWVARSAELQGSRHESGRRHWAEDRSNPPSAGHPSAPLPQPQPPSQDRSPDPRRREQEPSMALAWPPPAEPLARRPPLDSRVSVPHGLWGFKSVLNKVDRSAGSSTSSLSAAGSVRQPLPGPSSRSNGSESSAASGRKRTGGRSSTEPASYYRERSPLGNHHAARELTYSVRSGAIGLEMPDPDSLRSTGNVQYRSTSSGDRVEEREEDLRTSTDDDDEEWKQEMSTLRQEVGRALGEVDDARSAAAAALEEADELRKRSLDSSPMLRHASGSPEKDQGHSLQANPLADLSLRLQSLPSEMDFGTSSTQGAQTRPTEGGSIVPPLNLPDLTHAELRVAELERSLRIMNETNSKQTNAIAAIGMRHAMAERLAQEPATIGLSMWDSNTSARGDARDSSVGARSAQETGDRTRGRRRGRSASASPSPPRRHLSKSRSPYAPRGRPSSAHSSPGKRVRWATSIGRRTGSRSPSAWKPSSRAASSPSPARPRQYRSAGRNVGFKHSKKREQLKELKRTRLAVEKLREQLSSTGNKREVLGEIAALVQPLLRSGIQNTATGETALKRQENQRGRQMRETSVELSPPSSGSSRQRSSGDITLRSGMDGAVQEEDFAFSPPRATGRGSEAADRNKSPGSGGSFDLVEAGEHPGVGSSPLACSGRMMRVVTILEGLRRDHPAAPLTEALQLCRDEAVESDRTKRTLARSRDDLLAEAEQERERVRMAESHLRRAHAALAEADSARQHIQNDLLSAQASAASNQQALDRLSRDRSALQARITELEDELSGVQDQSEKALVLEEERTRLEGFTASLEQQLREAQGRCNELEELRLAGREETAALRLKLDLSERKVQELAGELDKMEGKMKKLQGNVTKKDRESFRMATDLEEALQLVAELTAELQQVKTALLDKSTEALVESKRAEDLREKLLHQDAEIQRITKEVNRQQQELADLRAGAKNYIDSQSQNRLQDAAIKADSLALELKATQELLASKSRQVDELHAQLEAASRQYATEGKDRLVQGNAELDEVMEVRRRLRDPEQPTTQASIPSRRSKPRRRTISDSSLDEDVQVTEKKHALHSESDNEEGPKGAREAYGRPLALSGADSYKASVSRASGGRVMSLEDIAAAPSAFHLEETAPVDENPQQVSSGQMLRMSLPCQPASSGPLDAASRPARSRRSPLNSPRNARRSEDPSEDAPSAPGALQPTALRLRQYSAPAASPKGFSTRGSRRLASAWSTGSEGNSSSGDDEPFVRRRNLDKAPSSYHPSMGSSSPGGQDLEELRRRLQSFKADTAVSILGKSQAVMQQMRRMQNRGG